MSSRTVDTHVAVLRRKLGHAPQESGYVVTVAEAGYRLRERPALRHAARPALPCHR